MKNIKKFIMNKDIRDIFFDNIRSKFIKNNNIFILTNDADVFSLKKSRKHKRFIDVGVSEQNLINVASGLSKSKKISIIYGFCTFLTFRCYEQIKFNIASHKLECKIIGVGPGFSFSNDGPTHHAIQDIMLMYLIPEMEIINVSDNILADTVSKKILLTKGPLYVRLDKGNLNYIKNVSYDLNKGFEYIYKIKNAKKLIITTGYFCKNSIKLAKKQKNIDVINFFRFKKFNKKLFISKIAKYKKIIVYDENTFHGGISTIIENLTRRSKKNVNISYLNVPNLQLFKYSQSRERIHKILNISYDNLLNKIKKNDF